MKFSAPPAGVGPAAIAVFEDTCGNRIQLFQRSAATNLQIRLNSVMVGDQDKALKFYTETLGFVKKRDITTGASRRLTVVSPTAPEGAELVLEPMGFAPAMTFQEALRKRGIPWTQFAVANVQETYERLTRLGVVFHTKPMEMGPVIIAMFDDTCGNLIQLIQQ